MKINRLFLYAAALVMAVSCGKETPETPKTPADGSNDEEIVVPPAPDYAVSFTAYTETPPAAEPEAKATIGLNTNTKPQTFWEDGDVISVYSSNESQVGTTANNKSGYLFSTTLVNNSTSATFSYDGEQFVGGNYIAIYPHTEAARVVNFTAQELSRTTDSPQYEGAAYRIAKVSVPTTQTLVAGGFDRSAMVMTAYTENPSELHFKNAVALVKFNVADADVSSGAIIASGSVISGTFRADIKSDTGIPILVNYGQTASDRVNFSTEESLSTTEEYYVAVRPDKLNEGFKVYLNNVLVKSYTQDQVGEFERNKIYDLGTLTMPGATNETKTLSFDFNSLLEGWPTSQSTTTAGNKNENLECTYNLEGVNYTFILANPIDADVKYPYCTDNSLFHRKYRYLGLPIIEGYTLTGVTFTNASTGAKTSRALGISSTIASGSNEPEFVAGGQLQYVSNNPGPWIYDLEGTSPESQYYLWCTEDTLISNITLTYTQITE